MHSFISCECVDRLKLPTHHLSFDLLISTPTFDLVVTSNFCSKCLIVVNGREFCVNLICLPLSNIDVILGMNWLSSNHILIDYARKTLIILYLKNSGFVIVD